MIASARAAIVENTAPKAYSPEDIIGFSSFAASTRQAALEMIAIHDSAPRVVRYVSDLRRWLLTQAMLALHFEHKTDPSLNILTAKELMAFIAENKVATRNTVTAFLAEMRAYKLFNDIEIEDKRNHPLVASDRAEGLIREWFDSHMRSLDALDGGYRAERSAEDPRLLYYAQPIAVRKLVNHPGWNDPSPGVMAYTGSAAGSNIIHDLIARAPVNGGGTGKFVIGKVKPTDLSSRYGLSPAQTKRVINRSQELGDIGWTTPPFKGDCWISARLVEDYRLWQAVKFSALSEAVAAAWSKLDG